MFGLNVIFEDNHLLVVNKPATLPTMGVAADKPSLLSIAKSYIKQKYDKPGKVYLGVVSRLDAPVTGVVVIARTSKAAARLTKQFKDRSVRKTYLAVVSGEPSPVSTTCVDWLIQDARHRKMYVTRRSDPHAQEAKLRYELLTRIDDDEALLRIELLTGRKHQIRVQLSKRDLPIVGDRKYNSATPFSAGIALHARQLHLEHPVLKKHIEFVAPIPHTWKTAWNFDDQLDRT